MSEELKNLINQIADLAKRAPSIIRAQVKLLAGQLGISEEDAAMSILADLIENTNGNNSENDIGSGGKGTKPT